MTTQTEDSTIFESLSEKQYKDAIFYLVRRVVQLTTKVKSAGIGKSTVYYNYEDEIIARVTDSERRIELTDKIDEETSSGLKSILKLKT